MATPTESLDPAEAGSDTPTRILDAAEALFVERGFAATSVRAIAERAGVSLGAAHYHFGSKQALFGAVVDRRFAPVARRIRVRWIDPSGVVVQEEPIEPASGRRLQSALDLSGERGERYGIWRVEARLEGQVLDKHTFHYAPPSSSSR